MVVEVEEVVVLVVENVLEELEDDENEDEDDLDDVEKQMVLIEMMMNEAKYFEKKKFLELCQINLNIKFTDFD